MYEEGRERRTAYSTVLNAIRNGSLVRPDRCQGCGIPEYHNSYGRSEIQAHHADYSKPLDVEWLCRPCHNAEQRRTYGERNGCAKLTAKIVRTIRSSCRPNRWWAERLGIHPKTVDKIKRRERWKHI